MIVKSSSFYFKLILLWGLTCLGSKALGLPSQATVTSVQSEAKASSISWAEKKFTFNGISWARHVGRVVLGEAPTDPQSAGRSESPFCLVENGSYVAYVSREIHRCVFFGPNKDPKAQFEVQFQWENFSEYIDPDCKKLSIEIRKTKTLQKGSSLTGYWAMTCLVQNDGVRVTLDHSENFSLVRSKRLEIIGKFENYKTYDFIGMARIANKEDLVLNSFRLQQVGETDEASIELEIYRKSFLVIRQSPFEIDVGAGFGQASFAGDEGSTSSLTLRGYLGMTYLVYDRFLLRGKGVADIFSSEEDLDTSYFFYDSQALMGYRFGDSHQVEVVAGLTFSKFSYQIGDNRRLFSRRGYTGQLAYRRVQKELVLYFIEAETHMYTSGDMLFAAKFGYRFWRETKITPWVAINQATLSQSGNEGLGAEDSGASYHIGFSLDF